MLDSQAIRRRMEMATELAFLFQLADAGDSREVSRRLAILRDETENPTQLGFAWNYLWAYSNKLQGVTDQHQAVVLSSAVAKHSHWVATGDAEGKIHIWETENWQPVTSLEFPGEVHDLEFSPCEDMLAVCGSGGEIRLFSTFDWELQHVLREHTLAVKSMKWTSDGSTLISGGRDRRILFWDTGSWQPRLDFVAHDTVHHLSLSADGRWLASGGDGGETKVWDANTGDICRVFTEHEAAVLCTALSTSGDRLAAGGYDSYVCVWDRESGKCLAKLELNCQAWSIDFLPHDDVLVIGTSHGYILTYDLSDIQRPRLMRRIKAHDHIIRSFELFDEARRMVTVSNDGTAREIYGPLDHFSVDVPIDRCRAIAFSAMGDHMALAHHDGKISCYRSCGELLYEFTVPETQLARIAFAEDAALVTAVFHEKSVIVRHYEPGGEIRSKTLDHPEPIRNVWLSKDGKALVSLDKQQQLRIWALPVGNISESCLRTSRVGAC